MKSKILFLLSMMLTVLSCTSCFSGYQGFDPDEEFEPDYRLEKPAEFNPEKKHIYIRLHKITYNVKYTLPNLLKHINIYVDLNESLMVHSSVSFDLTDNFYSISPFLTDGRYLAPESCTNISTNSYFKSINPDHSDQITYAIEVTDEEYEKAKLMVKKYDKDIRARYRVAILLRIGAVDLFYKWAIPWKKRDLDSRKNKHNKPLYNAEDEANFVCSTFISYVLINSVESVKDFFTDHRLDYMKIHPSDLSKIPSVEKLFVSDWRSYNIAAEEFMKQYDSTVKNTVYFDQRAELF